MYGNLAAMCPICTVIDSGELMIQDWSSIIAAVIAATALIIKELIRSKKEPGLNLSWNGMLLAIMAGAVVWLIWDKICDSPQVQSIDINPATIEKLHSQCTNIAAEKNYSVYCFFAVDRFCSSMGYSTGIPNASIEPGIFRVSCIGLK